MKKKLELPQFEKPDSPEVGAEKQNGAKPQKLGAPSEKAVKQRQEALQKVESIRLQERTATEKEQQEIEKKMGDEFLREEFIMRLKEIPKMFKGIQVDVAGEKFTLNFERYQKDGKNVEKPDEFVKEVEEKKLDLGRIDGRFELVDIAGRAEKLNLGYSLPIKRILTCQTQAALQEMITGSFAGTTEHYKKISEQEGEKRRAALPVAIKPGLETKEAKESKDNIINSIRSAAAKANAETSVLQGKEYTSVIIRLSSGTQLHLTSSDMAVWSTGRVDNGKMTAKKTTNNPVEFIRMQESEPGI